MAGLGAFFNQDAITGLFHLAIAAVLIPPITGKLPFRLSRNAKTVAIIACLFGSVLLPRLLYRQERPLPDRTTVKQNYKPAKSKPVPPAATKLSPEIKNNIDRYVNGWIRTKRFIRSGFWEGSSSPQVFLNWMSAISALILKWRPNNFRIRWPFRR